MAEKMKSASTAANWWRRKVEKPNVESYSDGIMEHFQSWSLMVRATELLYIVAESRISEFEKLLKEKIQMELDEGKDVQLDCDYEPYGMLAEVAELTSIPNVLFPYKRHMIIRAGGTVSIKDGEEHDWENLT